MIPSMMTAKRAGCGGLNFSTCGFPCNLTVVPPMPGLIQNFGRPVSGSTR